MYWDKDEEGVVYRLCDRCAPPPPLSLVSKLVTKSPHRSNCNPSRPLFLPTLELFLTVFVKRNICIAIGH